MKTLCVIAFLSIGILSCSKSNDQWRDYACEVERRSYVLTEFDTTTFGTDTLPVKIEDDNINVMYRNIPRAQLNNGNWYYYSDYPHIFKVKLIDDSLYIYKWSGGQGGGSSGSYSCRQL